MGKITHIVIADIDASDESLFVEIIVKDDFGAQIILDLYCLCRRGGRFNL
jgi:hypothetical protein